jgi:hypothetical protein
VDKRESSRWSLTKRVPFTSISGRSKVAASCLLSIMSAHRIAAELVDSKVLKAAYFAADPSGGAMDRCAATGR